MNRKKGIKGKTVRKLYRLARELEAIYGIRIVWGSGFDNGKRYFYFEPVPKNRRYIGCFCTMGFAYTVRDALFNFYHDWTDVLYCEKFPPEQRGEFILVKTDYQPGRYQYDPLRVAARGLHPRHYYRNPDNGRIYEYHRERRQTINREK